MVHVIRSYSRNRFGVSVCGCASVRAFLANIIHFNKQCLPATFQRSRPPFLSVGSLSDCGLLWVFVCTIRMYHVIYRIECDLINVLMTNLLRFFFSSFISLSRCLFSPISYGSVIWVGLALDTGWLLKVPDLLPSRLSRTKGDLFYSVNTISLSCSFATLISNFGRFAVMARIFSFSILLIHTNVFIFILRFGILAIKWLWEKEDLTIQAHSNCAMPIILLLWSEIQIVCWIRRRNDQYLNIYITNRLWFFFSRSLVWFR